MSEYPYQEVHPMGGTESDDSVVVGAWKADEEICLSPGCGASRTALREMIAEGGRGNLCIVEIITGNCPSCLKAIGGKE